MRFLILALLLVTAVSAYSISDYPSFFAKDNTFNAIYVVGEEAPALDVVSATAISSGLAKYNLTTEVGTSHIDREVLNITRKNAIVVGSPCENTAAAMLEGNPKPCYKGLGGSVGYIKLFEHGSKVQVLITGLTEEDRHAAAKYLANKELSGIKTKEYMVQSYSGSSPAFFKQKQSNATVKNASDVPEEETTDGTVKEIPEIPPEPPKPRIQEREVGEYEPIEEIEVKEYGGSVWSRFWDWLKSLFS